MNIDLRHIQLQNLIHELDSSELNTQIKKKTIETLGAITQMLQDLKDKNIYQQNSCRTNRTSSLKKQFNVRIKLRNNY